jgi:hypothetical protein
MAGVSENEEKLNAPIMAKTFYRYLFYLFWGTAAILVILRTAFDTTTYFFGSTLEMRALQPGDYEYLLHLPPGYTDFGNPRPLIVFLHGAGEVNTGLDVLKQCDLWHYAKGHIPAKDFPFIVVSPVTPKHGWEPVRVKHFVEQIVQDHRLADHGASSAILRHRSVAADIAFVRLGDTDFSRLHPHGRGQAFSDGVSLPGLGALGNASMGLRSPAPLGTARKSRNETAGVSCTERCFQRW